MKRHSADSGQTLVEAAIVVPMLAVFFMCMLQLMVLAHARVMVEYAAFNAARAGVVNNASTLKMRSAAVLSMLPVYGRTDTLGNFTATWGKMMLLDSAGALVDQGERYLESAIGSLFDGKISFTGALPSVALVDVLATNPLAADFSNTSNNEIDLDLPSQLTATGDPVDKDALRKTRLTIVVTALVPMRIPVGGRLIFYLWMISRFIATPGWRTDYEQWLSLNLTTQKMEDLVNSAPSNGVTLLTDGSVAAAINDALTYLVLSQLALNTNPPLYFFPLSASCSMPLESNAFLRDEVGEKNFW